MKSNNGSPNKKHHRPTEIAEGLTVLMKRTEWDISDFKTTSQLYDTTEKKEFLKKGLMSDGRTVDIVLVWKPPENKDYTNEMHLQRKYFEDGLTKKRVLAHLATSEAKLQQGDLSPSETEKLKSTIELEKSVLEFSVLHVEHEIGDDGMAYTKLHAPFKTLCHLAEQEKLVLPLKPNGEESIKTDVDTMFKIPFASLFTSKTDVPEAEEFFSGEFKYRNLHKFLNSEPENQHKFFSQAQRVALLHQMLSETRYEVLQPDNENIHRVGVDRMVRKTVYLAAFALHDYNDYVPLKGDKLDLKSESAPQRPKLYEDWARWRNWYKPQPIERIRLYFGEKIGFYFLWLGFYLRWLYIPGIVGLAIFIYGMGSYKDRVESEEFCQLNLTMCGICSTCNNWNISEACQAYRFSWVFDNGGTVLFAGLMAIWATLFQEFWKRQCATTAYEWDMLEFEETERQRPEFKGTKFHSNPITGTLERYFPPAERARRYFVSFLVVLLMLTIVIWSVIGMIIFRLAVRNALYSSSASLQNSSGAITSALAAVLSLFSIIVLNKIYGSLATNLTEYENHEKQTEYEQSLTLKVFLFQFVNSYSSIFYIAFFKGRFVGRPGSYNTIFGLRQDDCPEYGCMLELTIQLAIIMVGKQAIGNIQEIVLPMLQDYLRSRASNKLRQKNGAVVESTKHETLWAEQFYLADYPPQGLFGEYLEMAIQYGFITLFVAAFPLAPWFAMANNVLEIRVDALKLIRNTRRPFAARAENIGVWQPILSTIGVLAVITNAFVIAVSSNFIPRIVYEYVNHGSIVGYSRVQYALSPLTTGQANQVNCYYKSFRKDDGEYTDLHYQIMMARLAFVICFEHFVFFVQFIFAYIVPDVPRPIANAIKKEAYIARVALEEALYGADERAEMKQAEELAETSITSNPEV